MSLDEAINGTGLLDEQPPADLPPSPSPNLRPNRGVRSLFFSGSPQPEEEEEPPPSPSLQQPGDGSVSGSEWPSDEDEEPDSTTTSSPGSSADAKGGPLKPLTKAALKATTAQAVLIGSAMAHRVAARTEGQRVVGLYLADEQDADNIGDPLASIMHRRGGIAGGAMNPDVNDGLQIAMALANYVSKQVVKVSQAREVDQHLGAGGTLAPEAAE
jgi:hypothetical protein